MVCVIDPIDKSAFDLTTSGRDEKVSHNFVDERYKIPLRAILQRYGY
jgi:hypothetical protein